MLIEVKKIKKEEMLVVTSLDVAETFEKEHRRVLQDIRELKCSEEFRLHNFEQSKYINSQNHKQSMYYITRDGFTLLAMGYTGKKAMKFKEAYIQQFNRMEKLLTEKHLERVKGIGVRHVLTDAIQKSKENERMHNMAYPTYTDLVYRTLFGKSAKQIRDENNLDKADNLRDLFTGEDLLRIQQAEMLVSSLIAYGWGYNRIKEFLITNTRELINKGCR